MKVPRSDKTLCFYADRGNWLAEYVFDDRMNEKKSNAEGHPKTEATSGAVKLAPCLSSSALKYGAEKLAFAHRNR